MVSGSFIISGTYKKTDLSINTDDFNFDLPFKISIDDKYDTSEIKMDINDFYYEIINNNTLSVNIEVLIDELKEKKEEVRGNLEVPEDMSESLDLLEEELECDDIKEREVIPSIFDDINDSENYVTYKVHVVSESDTIETILQKYEINLSKLEDYNNISDLKIGDKIIIPSL